MIIKNFSLYKGQHCETTATGALISHAGITLSEPMLFGIGQGLGFIYWNMKSMDFPFIGGRIKPDTITTNLAEHLNLQLTVTETSSKRKAWDNVVSILKQGLPAGLKLDCYYLDYFKNAIHFAAHYTTLYGYDETHAYLNDTMQQGTKGKTTLGNLDLARSAKGPMSSNNLCYSLTASGKYNIKDAVKKAIKLNAQDYLQPAITNMHFKGIKKTGKELINFFKQKPSHAEHFKTMSLLMERAGTGGSLFRNLYRDFLKESAKLLGSSTYTNASEAFSDIAEKWHIVSKLFFKAGEKKEIEYIEKAADIMSDLSELEEKTMTLLTK
jgi:hypothetical protein